MRLFSKIQNLASNLETNEAELMKKKAEELDGVGGIHNYVNVRLVMNVYDKEPYDSLDYDVDQEPSKLYRP